MGLGGLEGGRAYGGFLPGFGFREFRVEGLGFFV